MLMLVAHHWWAVAVRGLVALVFGVVAILWPGLTLLTLVLLFGAYAFVDGVFAIASGIRGDEMGDRNFLLILGGIVGLLLGIVAVMWPGITALILLSIIAAWAVLTGLAEIAAAVRLRNEMRREWVMALNGVLSLAFGLILFAFPGSGALALVWVIGWYAIISGVILLVLSVQLRSRIRGGQFEQPFGSGTAKPQAF
jgi:uncharacterized membrane protein HdeD (DUF308 family)